MKLAWALTVIGTLLLLEGTVRVVFGFMTGGYLVSVGGMFTGWLIGGLLLRGGLKRRKRLAEGGN